VSKLPQTVNFQALIASEKYHEVWAAYFNLLEACMALPRVVSSLSPDNSTSPSLLFKKWGGVSNLERARDSLQTPKWLKLGPLMVAAVKASPSGIKVLHRIA
jgi:hypothetical protein